jgi:hypothetical protein
VMLRDGQPYFLDYQGGRRGALQYDIASILFDAKADLPPEFRQELLDYYLAQLARWEAVDRETFMRHYYAYVYIRIMQALGAYGFRGFYQGKRLFLQSVPYALKNIRWLLHNVSLPIELPSLLPAFQAMLASDKLQKLAGSSTDVTAANGPASDTPLTVSIFSFSFHRGGVPRDESGNGGGFVFDARAVPNPGRQAQFKDLTGRDSAVAEYLKQQPETTQFVSHTQSLVEASIRNYLERGFQHLQVAFGCTGGQHRSVYFAEALASHLRDNGRVRVVLHHLELEKLGR